MNGTGKIIAIVAVVAVVAVAAAFAMGVFDNDDESDPTYYIYLDGMGGELDGWYTGTGTDASKALTDALTDADIEFNINEQGWIAHINNNIASNTPDFSSGTGYSVLGYRSNDVSSPYEGYFTAGGGLANEVSNIIYVSFGAYTMNTTTYETTYAVTPFGASDIFAGGPFGASA